MASADDILKLYTTIPQANVVEPTQPVDKSSLDILKLYTAEPAKTEDAATGKKADGKFLSNSENDGTWTALGKNIATGAIKGAGDIAGFVGNADQLGGYLYDRAASAMSGKPMEQIQSEHAAIDAKRREAQTPIGTLAQAINPGSVLWSGQDVSSPVLARTGEYVPAPNDAMGRLVQAGTEAAVGSFAPGIRGVSPGGAAASIPAAALSGAAGQAATEATGDPLAGIVGGMAPGLAAKGMGAGVNKLIGSVSPERAALAATARDQYNIPLNAGQISESPFTRVLEDTTRRMPFSGAGKVTAEQSAAWQRGVAETFGENASKITPQVMAQARDRIGKDFETVAQQTKTVPDQPLMRDLAGVVRDTQLGPAGVESRIRANIAEIGDRIQRNNGEIPYQDLTRVGSPSGGKGAGIVQKLLNDPDPNVRAAGQGIRNALDDALQRQAPPDMVNKLMQARAEWKSLRTVEDIVPKGESISPALLQGRVNAKNKGTYGRAYGGGGDLGELADIGQSFMKAPPNSNTADRSFIHNLLLNTPGAIAAAATGDLRGLAVGPAIAGAGMLAGRAAHSILSSDTLTNALIARSLGRPQAPGVANKLLNSALPNALLQIRSPR